MSTDTKTVKNGRLSAKVGRLTFKGRMMRDAIGWKLGAASEANERPSGLSMAAAKEGREPLDLYQTSWDANAWRFASAVAQTREYTGFDLPLATDSPERILECFEALDKLPLEFVDQWIEAAEEIQASYLGGALKPELTLEEAKNPT